MLYKYILKLILLCLFSLNFNPSAQAQSRYSKQIGLDVLHNDKNTSLRFRVAYAYQITPEFSAGVGAGFTYYNDPLSLLPVFAELNYSLTQNQLTPYLLLRAGYNFSILTETDTRVDSHRGGLMLNPGIGLKLGGNSGIGWNLSVGYNLDNSQFEVQEVNEQTIKTDITYKRLMAGFGLSF
jgi:long-subunit fatty acid transport protein